MPINCVEKFRENHVAPAARSAGGATAHPNGGHRVKRNLFAGRPRSGGLQPERLHRGRARRHPLRHARGARAHRRVRRGRRGARHLLRRRLRGRPRDARGAHPAARRRRRHPLGARHSSCSAAATPKNDIVLEPGRVAFTNFSEGIRVIDSAHRRDPQLDQGRHRRHRPPQRLPVRHRHLRDRRRRQRRAARDLRRAQRRDAVPEHDQADRHRPLSRTETIAIFRMARRDRRRRRRAAPAPDRLQRRLPGEPAQAAARGHRGDHRDGPLGHSQQHPLAWRWPAARRRSRWPARWSPTTPRCWRASRWRSSPSAARPASTAARRRRWT